MIEADVRVTGSAGQLRLEHVSFSYGPRQVLRKLDLVVGHSEIVAVLGPSGCGKTTIVNLAAGFLRASSGTIRFGDAPVEGPSPDRMVVSQEDSVFPWLTVAENVGFGCRVQRSGVVAGKQGAVDLWLGRVGLDQVAGAYPRELSGGMRQRVALARAWANEPELLMLDEPLRSLDWPTRLGLQDLIRTVSRRIRQTVLLVTHDPDEALAVADRVVVLDRTAKTVASVTVDLGEGTGLRRRMNHRFSLLQAELSALVYRAAALEGP